MTKKISKKEIALSVLKVIFSPSDVKKFASLRGVVMCGLPGCGKSTIAELLDDAYGFEKMSTDDIRVKEMFKHQGHRRGSHEEVMLSRYMVYGELARRVNKKLNDKKKVVVDGTNMDEKRFNILGAMLSKLPSSKMAVVVIRTPEWILKKRFENLTKKEHADWWRIYRYWTNHVRKGEASFPKKKELSNVQIIKPKRYAIRTFDWVTDIKAIGWDLDGTLYPPDSIPNGVFVRRQVKAVMEQNNWTRAKAKSEYKKNYTKLGSNTKTMNSLGVDGVEFFKNLWSEIPLEKYIKPDKRISSLLRKLKNFNHFMITNATDIKQVRRKLKLIKLSHKWFDPVVLASKLGSPKPDVKGFRVALSSLKLKPHEILYVGDRDSTDIAGAKKAGMRTCLVYGRSKEADVSLKNTYEVAELFGKEV